jgi:hypothetical protein
LPFRDHPLRVFVQRDSQNDNVRLRQKPLELIGRP